MKKKKNNETCNGRILYGNIVITLLLLIFGTIFGTTKEILDKIDN